MVTAESFPPKMLIVTMSPAWKGREGLYFHNFRRFAAICVFSAGDSVACDWACLSLGSGPHLSPTLSESSLKDRESLFVKLCLADGQAMR